MWISMCQFVVCFLVTPGGKTNPSRTTPSAKATPTSKEAGKGISLTIPRYDLDEAITQISQRYGIQVISQPYAKPRVNIALLNAKGRPMVFRNQSLEQVFNTLARLFQYDWFKLCIQEPTCGGGHTLLCGRENTATRRSKSQQRHFSFSLTICQLNPATGYVAC